MREIKFRFWDIESPDMFTWEEMQEDWGSEGYYDSAFRGDHWIPMQYTGLKDKNGKEIYEGDVLRINILSEKYPEYKFDGHYKVIIDHRGVCFRFTKLAWEDDDKNQYPLLINIESKFIYNRWFNVEVGCHVHEYDGGAYESV